MHIIKLNAIDSTNTYLRTMVSKKVVRDNTIVVTSDQTGGRGQMGTSWFSEPFKNLTFSVYKEIQCVPIHKQFYMSMAVAIAIYTALEKFQIPDLRIKWPNDILSANNKICGILIESIVKEAKLSGVIVGVGLNVNQTEFIGLQSVSSLKKITGKQFDLDELLHEIIHQLQLIVNRIEQGLLDSIKNAYESVLFRKDKPSTFKRPSGDLMMGFIRGVNETGKLIIELEDQVLETFDLKEVKLLY